MKKNLKIKGYQLIGWSKLIAFKNRTISNMSDGTIFSSIQSVNDYIILTGFNVTEVKIVYVDSNEIQFYEDTLIDTICGTNLAFQNYFNYFPHML